MSEPFLIKDCALARISTGESAISLMHLRDILTRIPLSSIYYHFWGSRLRPSLMHPEYLNDFAHFAHYSLNDDYLAERFGVIDPTVCNDLEELRAILIDIIEERLDEIRFAVWSKDGQRFHFLRSITVVFDTPLLIQTPSEFKSIVPILSTSSIFYHFIDARRRTPEKTDDFSYWLSSYKENFPELVEKIGHIDPYFLSLLEIRQKLSECFNQYLL